MARDRQPFPGDKFEKPKKFSFKDSVKFTKKFIPYLLPQIKTEIIVLLCTAVCAGCEIALPIIVRNISNTATADIGSLTVTMIIKACALYAAVKGCDSLANYLQTYLGHSMGVKIENKMREDMFDKLQTLSFTYFDNTKVGQLMSRMTSDLFDVAEWAHHFPEMVFSTVIKFIASFLIFADMDIRFALLMFVMMPLMIVLTKKSRGKMKETFRESRHQVGEINSELEDNFLGIRVVRSFTGEQAQKKKFVDGCKRYIEIKKKSYRYMSSFHSTVRLIDGLMYISVVGIGAYFMHLGVTTAGDFAASLLLVSTLLGSVRTIIDFSEQFSRGITGIERFDELMREEPDIKDSPESVDIENVKGKVEFKNVNFKYETRDKIVLNNLSFTISPGERLALVGPSGVGKTTICNLIPRFYQPTSGEIYLDGKNIKEITLHSLRKNIGVVAQDVYLFSGTIKENIAYGKPNASDDEIIEAAKKAGAHEFISLLPDGYDTYVGERGIKLSGGQKQRVSIARVFLKNPPLLLLDEATSALDNESEKLVRQSLERLSLGRTTLTIAHRLTTVINSDRIIVLTESGIAEQGTHNELLKLNGIYANMYKSAFDEIEVN